MGRPRITIERIQGDQWLVTVHAAVSTRHKVRVTAADLARFGPASSCEKLLEASFRFLLEREPNTSILETFDLPVIERYFPEYEREIKQRVASG